MAQKALLVITKEITKVIETVKMIFRRIADNKKVCKHWQHAIFSINHNLKFVLNSLKTVRFKKKVTDHF